MRTRKFLSTLIPALPMLLAALLVILVTVIFLTAMRSKAHAQFGGAEQPMFQMVSVPISSDPSGMGHLSNHWHFIDMPTNSFQVSAWTDRVHGVVFTNGAYQTPTNYNLGIYFTLTAALMRASAVTNDYPLSSNSTVVVIWRRVQTTDFDTLIWHSAGTWKVRRVSASWRIGSVEVTAFSEPASTQDQDLIIVRDNSLGTITAYTNGVVTAYNQTSAQLVRPDMFGNRGDAANRGAESYIKEVYYYPTNFTATAISNMHYYATNTYLYTP